VKGRHRRILAEMLAQPTAPFREEAVVEAVGRWAQRRGATLRRDPAGNVLLEYRRGRRGRRPAWVFAAHMDHPGFIVRRTRGRSVWAEFRGGVAKEYFLGARVRLFGPGGEVVGTIRSVRKGPCEPWRSCRVDLARPADVLDGTIGMWDLPALCVRDGRIISRACDDVVGSAAVICALDEILSRKVRAHVTVLLTRAEEAGFIGCLAACRARSLPRDATIVAVETSKATPAARLGNGVVVRVGDRLHTYDPALTTHVAAVAADLARRRRSFRFTRQLMPGGTCESTAYSLFGYRATGLCLPMSNYHNQGPRGRIAAERVGTGDFASLVALLVALAEEPRVPADTEARLKARLDRLLETREQYLADR